jgi:hypothetical protein
MMVRRHGKKITLTCEKKKKKEQGECSTGLDDPGAREPKQRRRGDQRPRVLRPGSFPFYFHFEFDCVELDR